MARGESYTVSNFIVSTVRLTYALQILTGTPTEKRHLGRSKRRWEDSIRMDLKKIGINTRNWVKSVEDRDYWRALVNAVLNLRVP